MPWAKGQSGNPKGAIPKGRTLTAAIEKILRQKGPDGRPNKELFAERAFELALEGNVAAIGLILNYVDGKPVQQVDLTSGGNELYKTYRDGDVERV